MKKSLRPQQAAPVQRQTTTPTTAGTPGGGGGVGPSLHRWEGNILMEDVPFAGDDAQ